MALIPSPYQRGLDDAEQEFQGVSTLLIRITPRILHEVIRYGASVDNPAARGLCRLFSLDGGESALRRIFLPEQNLSSSWEGSFNTAYLLLIS